MNIGEDSRGESSTLWVGVVVLLSFVGLSGKVVALVGAAELE